MLSNKSWIGILIGLVSMPWGSMAADIEATLTTSDASSGFKVQSSEGTTLFKISGDGALTLATSISASYLSTAARHTQSLESAAKTANYTMTSEDGVILVDSSSGAFTVTLPTAVGSAGRTYSVVMSGDGNTVTIDGNAAETIDGSLTTSLSAKGTALTVVSDGSNWHSLSTATRSNGPSIGKIAVVAPSGGDYTSPNEAVTDLASWCGSPSSSNPCLLYITSGYYTLTATVDLSSHSYVSVAGAGEQSTFLDMPNDTVLKPAKESEVRDLTIVGSGTTDAKYGIHVDAAAVLLNQVTVTMSSTGSSTNGIHVASSTAALTANSVTIRTTGAGAVGLLTTGVGGSITLNNLNISVIANEASGYLDLSSTGPIQIKNSKVSAFGSGAALSIATSAPSVLVRDSIVTANLGSGIGLSLSSASTVQFTNIELTTDSTGAPAFNAAIANTSSTVEIRDSRLSAPGNTALLLDDADLTVRVANSYLRGSTQLSKTAGTLNCFNIYDSAFSAISGTTVCDTNNN